MSRLPAWQSPKSSIPVARRGLCGKLTGSRAREQMIGSMTAWVNLVILTVGRPLPVYPYKQTFSEPVGTWQKCQGAMSTEPLS